MEDLIYILNVDGSELVSEQVWQDKKLAYNIIKDSFDFSTTYFSKKADAIVNKNFNKTYSCSLPISMDLLELEKYLPQEFLSYDKKDRSPKSYTKALVNVTFDRGVKSPKYQADWKTKKIRSELYEKGFTVDGVKYVEFKRSSSKAREGSTIFIKESLHEHMIKWSRLDIDFASEEEVDIASLRAYESLTLSGLDISDDMKNLVTIKPEQILIIKSFHSKFKDSASVTTIQNGKIATNTKEIEFDNDIWDGQCLLDYTLFNKVKRNDKGMMLLRNRWFKACGFNTNIKHFYKCYGIDTVYDMFGNAHNAKDIKMIITPSCLKILKFADKIGTKEETYNYWLDKIDSSFGICKSEKAGHHENCNQLSYQMINSMPLSKDDIENLAEKEVEYIKLIQNDLSAFVEHISLDDKSNTRSFIKELVKRNEDIVGTELYKDFKKDTLYSYRQNVKRGKIKLADTDYCVICSDIFEMLLATTTPDNQFDVSKQLLYGYEIYTPRYADGADVVGFRNPHIATGNVLLAKNKDCKQFESFFNLTDNIVVINAIRCQILDRLQGNDMDSDTVLLSINPILLDRAIECQKYLTPVNKIDAGKKPLPLNGENKSDIDYIISNNKIGDIVNLSQIFNSKYWDTDDETEKEKHYNQISQLSSLSQIEIDKAKKFFDKKTLDTNKYTSGLYHGLTDRPQFFKVIQKVKDGRKYNFYNCPMDYLQEIIDDITKADRVENVDIFTLFSPAKTTVNNKQIREIKKLVRDADKKIKAIYNRKKRTDHDDDDINRIENDLVSEVSKKKLSIATMQDIIRRIYSEKSKDEEISKYKMLLIKTVAKANSDNFNKVFSAKSNEIILVKHNFWNNL